MVGNFDAAAETLQKTEYKEVPLADFKDAMTYSKYYTSAEWRAKYADGTVTKWLQQVTDFFVKAGNIASPVPASTVLRSADLPADGEGLRSDARSSSGASGRRLRLRSSSAPARPAACSPTG